MMSTRFALFPVLAMERGAGAAGGRAEEISFAGLGSRGKRCARCLSQRIRKKWVHAHENLQSGTECGAWPGEARDRIGFEPGSARRTPKRQARRSPFAQHRNAGGTLVVIASARDRSHAPRTALILL